MNATVTTTGNFGLGRESTRVRAAWAIVAIVLGVYFTAWWLHLRPGIFSYDSGHFLAEVVRGDITNRKPFLFARFIELTSVGGRWFQATIFAQVALIVLFLSRIFAVAWTSGASRVWIVLGVLLVLNPYVANMTFYLQNDVLFCFGMIAILFETLLVVRRGRLTLASMAIVALASPMAFAFRENGLLFLPVWWVVIFLLGHRGRRLAMVSVVSTVVAYASVWGVDKEKSHDLLFPAVIHEIARLAQSDYRHGIGGRLAPETRDAVGIERLRSATSVYWPLYWDTVGFHPGGPNLAYLPEEQRSRIVRSFLTHDLLPNVPSIAGHRIEMLLGALLARAEFVDPYAAPDNLQGPLRTWKMRVGSSERGDGWLGELNSLSGRTRGWTWNAGVGIFVLGGMTLLALWRRDKVTLAVTSLLWLQLGVLFAVAPSAEYRYVFMFYLAPLLLLAGRWGGRPHGTHVSAVAATHEHPAKGQGALNIPAAPASSAP